MRRAADGLYIYTVSILQKSRGHTGLTVRSQIFLFLFFFLVAIREAYPYVRYTSSIDMWSFGCIVLELFLGLPVFPGCSEYNQLERIVEMLGVPPPWMIETGKMGSTYFEPVFDKQGQQRWKLKSREQYAKETGREEKPGKRYFQQTSLPSLIKAYPWPKKNMTEEDIDRGKKRNLLICFGPFY